MAIEADEGIDMGPEEELKPKPRRGRKTTPVVDDGLVEIDESYPGPHEEPPVGIDNPEAVAVMEAALEIFSEDMSPAEKARMEDELGRMQASLDDADKQIEDLKKPRGRAQLSIVEKLIEIMAAVDAVEKKGRNDAQKYNYQRATDVFNAVRPEFIKRNLLFTMSVLSTKTTVIAKEKGHAILAEVECLFTVRDTEGGELSFKGIGTGIDTGDKGVFKAITGAMKYGIRQLLMLPDENDPEQVRADERQESGNGPVTITSAQVAGVQQGGRQTNVTTAQINALKDMAGQLGMTPEALEAHIISTLGHGPELDHDLSPADQAAAIVEWVGSLSFEDCGKIVKGLAKALEDGSSS